MHTIIPSSVSSFIMSDMLGSINNPNISFNSIPTCRKRKRHTMNSNFQLSFKKDSLRKALALTMLLSLLFPALYVVYATRITPKSAKNPDMTVINWRMVDGINIVLEIWATECSEKYLMLFGIFKSNII